MARAAHRADLIVLLAVAVLSASAFTAAGCAGGSDATTPPEPPQAASVSPQPVQQGILDPHGNVVLYVTNHSLALQRVDIAIQVDGRPILDREFSVGSQHNFERFVLRLSPGRHTLTAQSVEGKARLKKSFNVTGKRSWVLPLAVGNQPGMGGSDAGVVRGSRFHRLELHAPVARKLVRDRLSHQSRPQSRVDRLHGLRDAHGDRPRRRQRLPRWNIGSPGSVS